MQESLILLGAVAVLTVPAMAIAALVVAVKAGNRCDALDRRVENLARELRWLRSLRGDETASRSETSDETGSGASEGLHADSGAAKEGREKRQYSFSFLEEKPDWEKPVGEVAGAGEKPPAKTSGARQDPGPKKSARKRSRRGRRGRGKQ